MFTIYSKPNCPYCQKAKDFLTNHGDSFKVKELDVGQVKEPDVEYYTVAQLQALVPGCRTVPQIFENDKLIGGHDALLRRFHIANRS